MAADSTVEGVFTAAVADIIAAAATGAMVHGFRGP